MNPRLFLSLALLAFAALGGAQARAQRLEPGYLVEMPSAERVVAEITGRNERDTALRRVTALSQLRRIVESLAGNRLFGNQLTPDEKRIIADYNTARAAIAGPIEAALTQGDRPKWFGDVAVLEASDEYRDELLGTFFSERWASDYLGVTFRARQNLRRSVDAREGNGASSIAFELAPAVRNRLRLEFAVAALLLAFAIWRERQTFGPDPGNPLLWRAGWRRYALLTITGGAINYSEETRRFRKVTDRDVLETTDTTVSFLLQGDDGGSVKIEDQRITSLGAKNARKMSAVLATSVGKKFGPCIVLLNHDNNSSHTFERALGRILNPWLWPVLPALWLLWTGLRMSSYSERPNTLFAIMFVGGGLLLFLFWRWRESVAGNRIVRFETTMLAPLKERLIAEVARKSRDHRRG